MTQTVLLADVAEKIAMGPFGSNIKVSTFTETGVPIISGQHLKGITIDDGEGYNFISEEHAERLKSANVFRGDVIFTHAGNIGQVAYIPNNSRYERYVLSQRQFYLRPTDALLPEYLTYYFRSPQGQAQLLSYANQTGVPSLSQPATNLKKTKIALPDIATQKKIADVLGAIDEKVELNRRMNETLEQIGQAIFRKNFLDNPKSKSWPQIKLGDLLELHYGKSLTANKRAGGSYPVYGSSGVVGYHGRYLVKAPGIIVGRKGNVGSVFWAERDFYPIDTVFYVTSSLPLSIVYFYLNNLTFINSDAAVPGLNRSQAYNMDILHPDGDITHEIAPVLNHLLELIRINANANKNLVTLRDELLPRLISGKLKV